MKSRINHNVRVKFYIEENPLHSIGVLAVFPYEKFSNAPGDKRVDAYSHTGQHVCAAPDYYKKLKVATKEEYAPLAKELEAIGYTLKILNKD